VELVQLPYPQLLLALVQQQHQTLWQHNQLMLMLITAVRLPMTWSNGMAAALPGDV